MLENSPRSDAGALTLPALHTAARNAWALSPFDEGIEAPGAAGAAPRGPHQPLL